MICDEKEILKKSADITARIEEISSLIDETSEVLVRATNIAVKDQKISNLLLEMADDIKNMRNSFSAAARPMAGELRGFAAEVNANDNYRFPTWYDSIIDTVINATPEIK